MILTQNSKKLNTKAKFCANNISSNVNFTFIECFKNPHCIIKCNQAKNKNAS